MDNLLYKIKIAIKVFLIFLVEKKTISIIFKLHSDVKKFL